MVPADNSDSGETDMKKVRREHPSAWLELTDNQTLPLLVDALLDSPPNREFNKTELGNHAGVSRESVRKYIDTLLKFDIIEEVPETDPQRYRLQDQGVATVALFELNSALNEAGTSEDATIEESDVEEVDTTFQLDVNLPSNEKKLDDITVPVNQ